MKFRILAAMLAVFALLAAACSGSDDLDITGEVEGIADDVTESEAEQNSVDGEAEAAAAEEAAGEDEDAVEEEAMEDDEAVEEEAMEDDEAVDAAAGEMRIVSLSPTATEMLFAVGAGDLVVAVDSFSNFPPEAPVTALSGFEPNIEAIAGFDPTHVLSSGPIEGLDAIGIDNIVLPAAVTFDDVYAQIEQVGAATGHVGDAAEVVANMQADIQAVLDSLPEREQALTYYHELDPALFSVTSNTFIGEVYTLLGLENAVDAADPNGESFGFPQVTEEFLITADPDIIFLADTLFSEQTVETVSARPGWDQMSAVQAGNIVELNDDIASRWSPRLVEFIEAAGNAVAAIEAVPAN